MKKKLVVSVALILFALLFAGCSQHNQSFIGMLKDISALERYSAEVATNISIKNSELSEALVNEGLPADLLENIEVKYKLSADTSQMLCDIEFEISVGDYLAPLSMFIDNSHVYVKVEDVLQLIENFSGDPELLSAYQSFFGDAEWVDLMSEESLEAYEELVNDATVQEYLKEYDLLLAALSKAYANFETNTFSAMSNSYKITLDNASLGKLIGDFFEYTVNNCDHIANCMIEYVNKSTFFDSDEKAEFAQSMREMAEGAAEVTKADISYFKTYVEDVFTNDECPWDFEFVYQIAKISSTAYKQELQVMVEIEDDYIEPVSISFNSQTTIRENKSLEISSLDSNAVQLDALIEAAQDKDYTPKSTRINVYLDSNYMSCNKSYVLPFLDDYDYADIDYKTINDYTYLPLRQISDISGMEANWDPVRKQPYVIINEQSVYLDAFVDSVQGVTYIKIRDFEKLGFMVDYEPANNSILLIK